MPLTSVKIWQRPAPRLAASATAVVSLPPRPRVVISSSVDGRGALALEAGDDDDLARRQLGVDPARLDAGDPGAAVAAVGGDAGLRAGQADGRRRRAPWSAIDSSVALWCSPGREQDVELARIGLVGDGRGQAEQLVGRVAHRRDDDDQVVAGGTLARDPPGDALDPVGVGDRRATELLDDEAWLAWPGHSTVRVPRAPDARTMVATTVPARPEAPRMCFDLDSHPPIAPIAGGALDGMPLMLTAADRQPVRRVPGARGGPERSGGRDPARRPRAPSVLRGARPSVRGERDRRAGHRLVRADGRRRNRAARGSITRRTSSRRRGPASRADITAAVEELSVPDGDRPAPTAVFTLGFCMGGRMSFLAATLGLDLAGVMGMYGTLVGPWRNDAPAPGRRGGAVHGAGPWPVRRRRCGHHARGDRVVRRRPDGRRRRPPARDLSGRAAQLLRPQGRPSSPTPARRRGTRSSRSSGSGRRSRASRVGPPQVRD